jgi:hypothetical protein
MHSLPKELLDILAPNENHYRPVHRTLVDAERALLAAIAARSVLIQPFWEKLANASVVGECTYGCPCLLLELAESNTDPRRTTGAMGSGESASGIGCEFDITVWDGRFAELEFRTSPAHANALPMPSSVSIYNDPVSD